jgi:hypothetical protein
MDKILFKSEGCLLKDNGTMADLSKKITLYLNELSDHQIVNLNNLVRNQSVDIIILKAGDLAKFKEVIDGCYDIINTDSIDTKSVDSTQEIESIIDN